MWLRHSWSTGGWEGTRLAQGFWEGPRELPAVSWQRLPHRRAPSAPHGHTESTGRPSSFLCSATFIGIFCVPVPILVLGIKWAPLVLELAFHGDGEMANRKAVFVPLSGRLLGNLKVHWRLTFYTRWTGPPPAHQCFYTCSTSPSGML